MKIINRLKNAYSYGGLYEIIRKMMYLPIYKLFNYLTFFRVKHSSIGYGVKKNCENKVIVSLTSFPERFPYIGLCLKSIVNQSVKPDRIIVYLGSDCSISDLTEEMLNYKKYGVEYRFDNKYNLMPHKKYYYAMQEYPDSIIVTADDDEVYPHNWLKSLLKSYNKYPSAISARRVHYIAVKDNTVLNYNSWIDQYRKLKKPSMQLIATGASGVLYPPRCFGSLAFDKPNIIDLALRADDIWLKCMEVLYSRPVVWVQNWQVPLKEISKNGSYKLSDSNVFDNNNDIVLNSVMKAYDIGAKDFVDF